ncbi:SdiA-regulated domain-containing protein [Pedobacter rhizosphaerae]|uniref:SdiA-regulated n=1 Tax=Pedobacter rhizosphaerae TaxID=390241 RepID=A0A1H9P9D4_9SPHI|nr:SdiA-regulated domain-containing protein [Pedobacter rhizosphaerae]SER44429.1 SdiA-regulated [Pedobacter rhizosphaerae]
MKHYKKGILFAISTVLIAFVGVSCVNGKHEENTTTETAEVNPSKLPYDLENPVEYNMPQSLFEISGIVFNQGKADQVYAIQDEDGDIFHLGLADKEAKYSKFGGKGDYEDLTIIKNQVAVLKSNGELHIFPLSEVGKPEITNVIKTKDLVPKAEYEGLAADDKNGKIYILTKESKADAKAKHTSIYAFQFAEDGSLKADGEFALAYQEIADLSGDKKLKFRPSALAKNPATQEWYVLSSINKLLVVTDADFKIKATYPLKGSHFNQPEGIAFDKDNNLYISNEGGTLSAGNILLFKHKP